MTKQRSRRQRLTGRPGGAKPPGWRRPSALLALAALAGTPPAPAIGSIGPAPRLHAGCRTATQHPRTVIRAWLETTARGRASHCKLSATACHLGEPAFGRFRVALIQPLKPESQPGHQLYLVYLISSTRAARYLLDLCPDATGHWLIDLWAEL